MAQRKDERTPEELKREEHQVVQLARHAMRNTVDQFAPPGSSKLALLAVAVTGLFGDLMGGLPYAPELASVVNKQLAGAGWELVPLRRN